MADILVIDDEAPLRSLIRRALAPFGHDVVEAEDGVQGIKRFASAPADLIITDIVMQGMEGMETIRSLRRLSADVPIIAMSGGGRGSAGDYLAVALALGASRTLTKPFKLGVLTGMVNELLVERQLKSASTLSDINY